MGTETCFQGSYHLLAEGEVQATVRCIVEGQL